MPCPAEKEVRKQALRPKTKPRFPPETTPLLLDYEECHRPHSKSGNNVVFMDKHVAPLDVASDYLMTEQAVIVRRKRLATNV
ncbi:MAG TPA: hypothetical protein P5186_14865 [Candidatus Paceibacterota bacterium]|nr:hypothetical protein [Verrucomicrobiota bacterium]HRY49328.1 hypothetical protein [Candidatus Paceibacterota bacterium]